MRIFIKLLALSLLLTGCSKTYGTKPAKTSAHNSTNQVSSDITNHVVDVGDKVAIDASSIPTNLP